MTIDKKFIDQFIYVTSKAALASSYLVGKKDKISADKAAVDSMRSELNKINIKGEIVIGGAVDRAPKASVHSQLIREEHKSRIGAVPKNRRLTFIVPREHTKRVGKEKTLGIQVTPKSDNIFIFRRFKRGGK